MITYLKIHKHHLNAEYRQLAKKIWGFSSDSIIIDHLGSNEDLNNDLFFNFAIDIGPVDPRWAVAPICWSTSVIRVSRLVHDKDMIVVYSRYVHILPIDQKAFYNFVDYLANELDGIISEDDGKTWITPLKYEQSHGHMMQATFDELSEKSLKVAEVMPLVDSPDIPDLKW